MSSFVRCENYGRRGPNTGSLAVFGGPFADNNATLLSDRHKRTFINIFCGSGACIAANGDATPWLACTHIAQCACCKFCQHLTVD